MILSDLYVAEGRSHPELNPKRDIISELAPYHYDPNAYITFVSDAGITSHVARGPVAGPIAGRGRDLGNSYDLTVAAKYAPQSKVRNGSGIKVGINPSPMSYETPVGVYAYPLREVWEDLVADSLPYARQKPFLVLLRSTGHLLDLSQYTEGDLSKDIAKLTPVIANLLKETDFQPLAAIDYWTKRVNASSPGAKIWIITRGIAEFEANRRHAGIPQNLGKSVPIIWNAILRSLGYSGVDDRGGESIIHSSEPVQTLFLNTNAFEVIEAFDNRHPMHIQTDEGDCLFR